MQLFGRGAVPGMQERETGKWGDPVRGAVHTWVHLLLCFYKLEISWVVLFAQVVRMCMYARMHGCVMQDKADFPKLVGGDQALHREKERVLW